MQLMNLDGNYGYAFILGSEELGEFYYALNDILNTKVRLSSDGSYEGALNKLGKFNFQILISDTSVSLVFNTLTTVSDNVAFMAMYDLRFIILFTDDFAFYICNFDAELLMEDETAFRQTQHELSMAHEQEQQLLYEAHEQRQQELYELYGDEYEWEYFIWEHYRWESYSYYGFPTLQEDELYFMFMSRYSFEYGTVFELFLTYINA
jgi:hypothetical protein